MLIHQAMLATDLTKKAIYSYESEGLIHPSKDRWNNYRDYSPQDVQQLIRISVLRRLDFLLHEIRPVLQNSHELGEALLRHDLSQADRLASLQQPLGTLLQAHQAQFAQIDALMAIISPRFQKYHRWLGSIG
jgi:DNA-binding transcriptional MerR regulator